STLRESTRAHPPSGVTAAAYGCRPRSTDGPPSRRPHRPTVRRPSKPTRCSTPGTAPAPESSSGGWTAITAVLSQRPTMLRDSSCYRTANRSVVVCAYIPPKQATGSPTRRCHENTPEAWLADTATDGGAEGNRTPDLL